jgi:outer membrane protein OmpA-like peptidoglycan-associated protein
MVKRTLFVVCASLWLAAPVLAQDPTEPDAEGCKDSALLSRMPSCQLYECETKEYDEADVAVGAPGPDGITPTKRLEGALETRQYICPTKSSQLQIIRNMEGALKKAGFATVFSGKLDSDAPGVTVRKGDQWIEVRTEFFNQYPSYRHTEVRVTEMEQTVVADASSIAAAIESTGTIALYGITFDTGRATLQPGSEQVLGEILTLLKERADWRLEVQGHTDNVGAAAANQALSEQRARTVVAWLTKNGIAAGRLTAKGYGDTQPVADNGTDEGRAKNRRVELRKID